MALLTPINVNTHANDGRKVSEPAVVIMALSESFLSSQSTPLHLAAGYNRASVGELLLKHRADVHAKDKGCVLIATSHPQPSPSPPPPSPLRQGPGTSAQLQLLWPPGSHRIAAEGSYTCLPASHTHTHTYTHTHSAV